jgi:hypothetical protein
MVTLFASYRNKLVSLIILLSGIWISFLPYSNCQTLSYASNERITDFKSHMIITEFDDLIYIGSNGEDIYISVPRRFSLDLKVNIKDLNLQQTVYRLSKVEKLFEHNAGYFFFGRYYERPDSTGGTKTIMARLDKNSGEIKLLSIVNRPWTEGDWVVSEGYNGALLVGGTTATPNGRSAFIDIIDSSGNVLQSKSSNGQGGLWGDAIKTVSRTRDNNYIISGTLGNDWWLCKLDASLNVIWSRNLGSQYGEVKKIVELTNSNLVAISSTRSNYTYQYDLERFGDWLIYLSKNGNVLNEKFYLDQGPIDGLAISFNDIIPYCNDNFVLISDQYTKLSSHSRADVLSTNLELYEGNKLVEFGFNRLQTDSIFSNKAILVNKFNNRYFILYKSGLAGLYEVNLQSTLPDILCVPNPAIGCDFVPLNSVRYGDCEDFEGMSLGQIVPQATPRFTLFSNQSFEQAIVTNERNYSGNQSLKFAGTSDIDFNIHRTIQSSTRMEWMTYLPAGKTGSWGVETIPGSAYALVCQWNNGIGTIYTIENGTLTPKTTFSYPQGQWFKTILIFHPGSSIELWVGTEFIFTRPNFTSGRITHLNLYGTENSLTNEFYIDNLIYYETRIPCITTMEYNPCCVNGVEYGNFGQARCAGYTSNEIESGPCDGPPPPPPSSLTVDIDNNVCGAAGSIVEVPVRVSGYTGVAALQMIIASSNNSAAEILGVTSINPNTDIASSDFILTGGRLGLAYAFRPNTLANGSVLFSVRVRLNGSAGTNSLLTFDGQIVAADNAVNTVNATGLSGSVCISVATSSVGGTISTAASRVMAGVTVRTTSGSTQVNTALTNVSGNYSVANLTNGTSYTITPSFSDGLKDGLDVTDMLIMRRHMLGAALFTNGYMYVAADLNFDRVINVSDLLILRKIILDEITSLTGGVSPWRFIPSSYAFPSGNPLSGTIPSTISYNPLNGNQMGQNFTGVKYGDLNNSANFMEMPDDEGRSTGEVLLEIPEVSGKPGEEVSVDMRCRGFERGAGMQFSLRWPADQLELLAAEANTEGLGGTTWYNEARNDRGVLGVVWESEDVLRGTDVEDGGLCYRLRFRILGSAGTVAEIGVAEEGMGSMFVDSDLQRHRMSIQRGVVRVAETSATDEGGWRSAGVYPNPTTGILHLEYGKDTPQAVTLQTMEGMVLRKITGRDKTMDLSGLTAGVYMVKIQFSRGMVTRKVIVIK